MSYTNLSLFPINYPNLYKYYEQQRDAFWVPSEVNLKDDIDEWKYKLSDDEKKFLTYTLAFFAQADGIVLKNLNINFTFDINLKECQMFYGIQQGIEAIHWEMYSLLIDALIEDNDEKKLAFNAIENYPCIKEKAEWMNKYMDNNIPFLKRLVAFACTEGIFFSSAFASIFYFKKQGKLPGLCISNEFIARDEGLHRDFGCELFKLLRTEENFKEKYGDTIKNEEINEIIKESVDIEKNFIENSLNVNLIGINKEKMKKHVEFMADHLLQNLNMKKIYKTEEPFEWMNLMNLKNKTNFFEKVVTDYKKINTNISFDFKDSNDFDF